MTPASEEYQTYKDGCWVSELQSLGIDPKRRNVLNDKEELEGLTDNIKQMLYQDYKTAYSNEAKDDRFDFII